MNSSKLFFVHLAVSIIPDTRLWGLKRRLYRWAGANVGKNVRICSSAKITGTSGLKLGDNVWIGHDVLIVCSAPVVIGNDVNIAPRVYIGTGTHKIEPNGQSIAGEGESFPIVIGPGSWLCAGVMLLPGTKIGNMSIIAAGSVVKGEVPSFQLWGGSLAHFIKNL